MYVFLPLDCQDNIHVDEISDRLKTVYRQKFAEMLTRAEQIHEYLLHKKEAEQSALTEGQDCTFRKRDCDDSLEDTLLSDILGSSVFAKNPNAKWSAIAGLAKAKTVLQEAIFIPLQFPTLFVGNRKPWKGILLYGVSLPLLIYIYLFIY